MKPEEFTPSWQPSKHAMPGEGAWMSAGAAPPRLSEAFVDDARRLCQERRPSKEEIAELASRYEEEVRGQRLKEEARRKSLPGLARRGCPPQKEPQQPDLHPDLIGAPHAERSPKDLQDSCAARERKSSKDSQVLRQGSKDSRTSVALSDGVPRRKTIHEIISKNPQLKANIDRANCQLVAETRALDPGNAEDRAVLDDLFMCYDPNGDGTGSLSYKEFSRLVKALGLRLSKTEVEGMMKQLDDSGNGLIEIDEFALFFNHAGNRDVMKANVEGMEGSKNRFVRKLFEEFKDSSGRGITLEGLKLLVQASRLDKGANKLTPRDVDLFFKRLDINDTGFLTLDDVLYIFDSVEARDELKDCLQNVGARNCELLSRIFEKFDSSFEGHMNKFDLLAAARLLGHKVTQSSVDALLAKVDTDNNGTVELDEFLEFFEQMRSAEELLEEIENFKKSEARKKYLIDFIATIGVALVVGGIYFTVLSSDPAIFAVGFGATLSGVLLISPKILPMVPGLLYGVCVKQLTTFTPYKLCVVNFLVFLSIAALTLRQLHTGSEMSAELLSVPVQLLAAVLLLGCAGEVAWLGCQSNGLLDAVSEADSEMAAEEQAGQTAYLAQVSAMESGHASRSTRGSPGSKGSSGTISTTASHEF
jgi:Ca2+-binding EF-hand superfamily protein